MRNSAEIIEKNFLDALTQNSLPEPKTTETLYPATDLVDIFESQIMSRKLDLTSRILRARNESFYTIGSAGHEGNAVVGKVFSYRDPAFLHYRSGAFYIQRAKQLPGSTPLYDLLLSFVASSDDPISGGRHKVLGSVDLNIPPQTSTIASHLPKAVGAALSIAKAKQLHLDERKYEDDGVVLCSFGDASSNHSTALGAINTAAWCAYQDIPMPIVFVCEDNGIGISVSTPKGWIQSLYDGHPTIQYYQADGLNMVDLLNQTRRAERYVREHRRPVFLHIKTIRLMGHAGSDVETIYRSKEEIESTESNDPLLHSASILYHSGILSLSEIQDMYKDIGERCLRIAEEVIQHPKITSPDTVKESIIPPRQFHKAPPPVPQEKQRKELFSKDSRLMQTAQPMARLISWTLADLMLQYQNAVIFGEDVAAKGGVYHVTAGLYEKFGNARVFDSPLDEQSILGAAIGLGHNGFLPVPEIQFLAYVHNAEDQIRGEAATLSFFSKGQFQNPMVVRIAGLAYQKGFGGHFHNDNSFAVFRDIPGVIIACPSNGKDAVAMLRRAFRAAHCERRVVIFIEPIALYMTKDLYEPGDGLWSHTYSLDTEEDDIGAIGEFGKGRDLAIVSYGNGTYYSCQAQKDLDAMGIESTVFDVRWIAPFDANRLVEQIGTRKNILIVDECRETGSFSEAIYTRIEEIKPHTYNLARDTAYDCFIPLGDAATLGLPSRNSIVQAAKKLVAKKTTKPTEISTRAHKTKAKRL